MGGRRQARRCALGATLALTALTAATAGGGGALAAQVVSDSARAQVLDRLQRLARPPGIDSTLLLPDTARLPSASAGAASAGADSVAQALLALPQFTVTRYEGAGARFEAIDRQLHLLGSESRRARVIQEGFELSADSAIHYDEPRGRVRSQGPAEFTRPGGDPVATRALIYDIRQDRGTALGAVTTYSQGANWRVTADLNSITPREAWGVHAILTSCELEEPHYHFRTGQVKFINDEWFIARNVTLRFADVPVMWLPFIAQGMSDGRSSGLLTPRFSINDVVRTSSGYSRRISNLGFYWAMSDYSDMSIAVDWWSDRFLGMHGTLGYNWSRQFLQGGINYRQYWPAEGGRELAFNTRHDWDLDERTHLGITAAYASSSDFVRDNSFDPRELTQSIRSDGGISRRFDWGSINLGANRSQELSNDRVELTLPTASLSLSPITFFRASGSSARWYNNVTWSGGGQYSRRLTDQAQVVGEPFAIGAADRGTTTASVRSSFTVGALSLSQSMNLTENSTFEVPLSFFVYDTLGPPPEGFRDVSQSQVTWSASVDYQQNLIGSLTITPQLSLNGSLIRSDTIEAASSYVAGPQRVNVGATAKMDIYGFWPGFGNFEQIRHKISPQFVYAWSPEVVPTELQQQVFRGSRLIQATNTLGITINNTFEAKLRAPEDSASAAAAADSAVADSTALAPLVPLARRGAATAGQEGGPSRAPQNRTVTLLGISTSAVQYDFQADSTGRWEDGFQTTRLSNQITSDYLRGLNVTMEHDLFETVSVGGEGGEEVGGAASKRFAPHLSRLNLGFSLGANSTVIRWLTRLTGAPAREADPEAEPDTPTDEDLDPGEAAIIPRADDPFGALRRDPFDDGRQRSRGGGWSANLTYSLQRPRAEGVESNQLLTANVRFKPTDLWTVSWRTSYDVNVGGFLDHVVRLTRDLHRWEANFDFRQTLTGNWTFRFEVALRDNRDLKLDYEQRGLDERNSLFR